MGFFLRQVAVGVQISSLRLEVGAHRLPSFATWRWRYTACLLFATWRWRYTACLLLLLLLFLLWRRRRRPFPGGFGGPADGGGGPPGFGGGGTFFAEPFFSFFSFFSFFAGGSGGAPAFFGPPAGGGFGAPAFLVQEALEARRLEVSEARRLEGFGGPPPGGFGGPPPGSTEARRLELLGVEGLPSQQLEALALLPLVAVDQNHLEEVARHLEVGVPLLCSFFPSCPSFHLLLSLHAHQFSHPSFLHFSRALSDVYLFVSRGPCLLFPSPKILRAPPDPFLQAFSHAPSQLPPPLLFLFFELGKVCFFPGLLIFGWWWSSRQWWTPLLGRRWPPGGGGPPSF